MTTEEFGSIDLPTLDDALAVLRTNPFEAVCDYIRNGLDVRVTILLEGVWKFRSMLDRNEVLRACESALLSDSAHAYMRWSAASFAVKLAEASACYQDLRQVINNRWATLDARGANEVLLGLGDKIRPSEIHLFFGQNQLVDVRALLLRVFYNRTKSHPTSDTQKLLRGMLPQMSSTSSVYSRRADFEFVNRLKIEI